MATPDWDDEEALFVIVYDRLDRVMNQANANWEQAERELVASLQTHGTGEKHEPVEARLTLTDAEHQAFVAADRGGAEPWSALIGVLRGGPISRDMAGLLAALIEANAFHGARNAKRKPAETPMPARALVRSELANVKSVLDELFPDRRGATAAKAERLMALLWEQDPKSLRAHRKRGSHRSKERGKVDDIVRRALNARVLRGAN